MTIFENVQKNVPVIYDSLIKDGQMLVACKYQYNQQYIQILSKRYKKTSYLKKKTLENILRSNPTKKESI